MKIGSMSVHWTVIKEAGVAQMNGCLYYRVAMPIRELAKHGYDTTLGYGHYVTKDGHFGIGDSVKGEEGKCEPDIIIMQGWMGKEAIPIIQRARACGQIILQDVDDFVWGVPHNHVSRKAVDPRNDPNTNIEHFRKILSVSDGIITSTQFLADYLKRVGPPVYVCRNGIDLDQWEPYEQPEKFTVGYIGVMSYRANDLEPIVGVLGPYLEKHGAEFRHIGYLQGEVPVAKQLHLPDTIKTTVVPRTTMDGYPPSWEGLSMIVIPLERMPFNEGKSYLRGLEASAHALPFIATDLPEYRVLDTGRLATKKWQWIEQLEALADPETRKQDGILNRRRAEELSIERQWVQWAKVLEDYGVKPEIT